jgi:hypothetical protein
MSLLQNFNHYNNNRISTSLNPYEDYECIKNIDRIIKINDRLNEIILLDYIDYGDTSIIFKAYNKNKNIYFALKIMKLEKQEIEIMKQTTYLVKNKITPHLMILYANLLCQENGEIFDNIYMEDPNLIERFTQKLKDINKFIDNGRYSLLIMELFDGNLIDILFKNQISSQLQKNIYSQIILSILTFHTFIGIHNDAQYKNFFYKKIDYDDNDYFHYNVYGYDIYIKNYGYLVVLGDYGFSDEIKHVQTRKQAHKIDKTTAIDDYLFILNGLNFDNILSYNITSEKDFILFLITSTSLFLTSIPYNSIILNEQPYII